MEITFDTFFHPESTKGKRFKWAVIVLILLIGSCLFTSCLFNIIAYETACSNPVYVNATITVSIDDPLLGSDRSYISYLSYEYEGNVYSGVFYSSGKSPLRMKDDGEIISVALNPYNPAELAVDMINSFHIALSVIVLSTGVALLIYGTVIENDHFRQKRIQREQKKYLTAMQPDYFKDVSLTILSVISFILLLLFFAFPHTFGLFSIMSSL